MAKSRKAGGRGLFITVSVLAVLLVVILAVLLTSPILRPASSGESLEIGFTALDGRHYTTADAPFRGKVVLVDLMAANCPPCNAEMPDLISFRESIRGMDVEIISLSIWANQPGFGETVDDLRDFKERWGANWTFGVPDDTLALVVKYNIQFPPFKILLDRDGTVVWTKAGQTTEDVLLQAINEVV
jgi:thiol-disulfide isomerase/thioredoxin